MAGVEAGVDLGYGPRMVPVGQCIGRYVVAGFLGEGGTSDVYLVQADGKSFALKILKESHRLNTALQARLINEGEALRRLDIDGLVRIFDVGDESGRPFYVMERLIDSLSARLSRALPPSDVVPIIRQAARILSELHARGVVHRDVKPSNLLFARDGSVRLTDFGHAKLDVEGLSILPHSTETGAFVGTREYAAPEQLVNAKFVDGSADVYALGLILFEALSGRRPFAAKTPEELVRRRLTARAPKVSSPLAVLSPQFVALTAQMLSPLPADRPTACEVGERLGRIPIQGNFLGPGIRVATLLLLPLFFSCPESSEPRQIMSEVEVQPQVRVIVAQSVEPSQPELSREADALLHEFGDALDQRSLDDARAVLAKTDALPGTALLDAKRIQKQADVHRELGQFAEAQTLYATARSAFRDPAQRRDWAACALREADMKLHLGDAESARELYEDAAQSHSVVLTQQAQTKGKKNEVHLALFHLSQYWFEKHDIERARQKLQLAWDSLAREETDDLWKARTEERLAALPGTAQPLLLLQSSMDRARIAQKKSPGSRRVLIALLRAEYRYALLSGDTKDMDRVFSQLHSAWATDKRRALLAHDYLDLLMEALAAYPQRTDWRGLARELVTEVIDRDQFRGDVHLYSWRRQLFP